MRKSLRRVGLCALVALVLWSSALIFDKHALRNELIRLHVVAASDSEIDQALKLQVRDSVINSLRENMQNVTDTDQAKAYLNANLSKIEALANDVLRKAGCNDVATVSLKTEEFPIRHYDTFTLPAGVYESLRIMIGQGQGHNWWCVVFPALCVGATAEAFAETAQCAGFSESLTATLAGEDDYEVRFLILDVLGRMENFLHKG